jgi:tetratricopeptide (TPR) repeat protein
MRRVPTTALVICVALGTLIACGDPGKKESIEKANEAVDLATQGRMSEAETLLEESTAAWRDNHNAWYNLGQVRDQLKKYDKAVEAYGEAARIRDSDAMYHYKLGKAYKNNDNFSQAETHLEKAVQLNPKLYGAQFELGTVYEKRDKPKEAAEAYTKSASLSPTFGKPFRSLGLLYIRWDMLAEAISVLDQGRLNVRDSEDLTDIYYHLGLAYGKQGNWDQAIKAYSSALDARSGNLDALRQRGFAYAEKGDKAKAIKDLKEFVDQGGLGNAFHIQAANQRLFRLQSEQ